MQLFLLKSFHLKASLIRPFVSLSGIRGPDSGGTASCLSVLQIYESNTRKMRDNFFFINDKPDIGPFKGDVSGIALNHGLMICSGTGRWISGFWQHARLLVTNSLVADAGNFFRDFLFVGHGPGPYFFGLLKAGKSV